MKKKFKILGSSFLCLLLLSSSFIYIYKDRLLLIKTLYTSFSSDNNLSKVTFSKNSSNFIDTKESIIYSYNDNKYQTLDIYKPTHIPSNGSPVILYVHGGSWLYGDNSIPDKMTPLIKTFQEQGFSIISVNYELLKEDIQLQKPVSDVKDAIRWVYKNKDLYNFNTNEIGIFGISSGAHLSLLAAYSNNDAFLGDTDLASYPSKVKYLIDIAGPTDLKTLIVEHPNNAIVTGLNEIGMIDYISQYYSPINYVTPSAPNTLIIHSKKDSIVPFSNSEILHNKLQEVGCNSTLVTLNSSDHEISSISKQDLQPIIIESLKFIIRNTPI